MGETPRPYTEIALGILGPYGNVWTPDTFETIEEARKHVADFWAGQPVEQDLSAFKIVPVEVTVTPIDGPIADCASPTPEADQDQSGRG
jgi:hypothetical protein